MWIWKHREHIGTAVLAIIAIAFLGTALWLGVSDRPPLRRRTACSGFYCWRLCA
jgi:hypothetical protein